MTRRGGVHCGHRLQIFGTTCNGTPHATPVTPTTPAVVAPHITATTVATIATIATVAAVATVAASYLYPPIPPPHRRGLEKPPPETSCDGRYKHLPGNAFPVARSTVAPTDSTAAPTDSTAAIITHVAVNAVRWYGHGYADRDPRREDNLHVLSSPVQVGHPHT